MLDVELIYQAYPRHIKKRHALAAIEKAITRLVSGKETGNKMTRPEAATYLLERTRAFAQSFAGQRGVFTPHPATWMNAGQYMDDPEDWEYISPDEEKRLSRSLEANLGVSNWRPQ